MKPVTEAQTAVRGVIQPFVLTESQQIGVKSTRLAFLAPRRSTSRRKYSERITHFVRLNQELKMSFESSLLPHISSP